MSIKKVSNYNMFATGDACEFSMAAEPRYMREDLTPSKHYVGYITHVDSMHNEFTIAITNDLGKQITLKHYADPIREPIGLPLYFYMTVLLDKETYEKRVYSQKKREVRHADNTHRLAVEQATRNYDRAIDAWDSLEDR